MVIFIDSGEFLMYNENIKSKGDRKMPWVLTNRQMRDCDAATIREGIPSKELMRRAGEGIFRSFLWQGPVAVVCGSGNNGGDGYVLALELHKREIPVSLFLLWEKFSADGKYYFDQCVKEGISVKIWTPEDDFSAYTEIADCILGTGFSGEVQGTVQQVINAINQSGKQVISADINSGLCGDNGQGDHCVISHLTVSVGFYKYGHFLGRAPDVIGALCNIDIGIGLSTPAARLAEVSDFVPMLSPRPAQCHKGCFGYVSILGGCREYAGAIKLANISCAALRAGCGVVQLILPESLVPSVSPYLLESTIAVLPDREGHCVFDPERLDAYLQGKRALALGMGWGSSPDHQKILAHILRNHALSLCIDADGLNALAEMDAGLMKDTACRVILTPHPKEFSRLSGLSMAEIAADPVGAARDYAKKYGVILLLKGACTLVTDGEKTLLVRRGCAGMATAGSGDVLSGVMAGLLGWNEASPTVAALGAYLCGLAGELAQEEVGDIALVASDTVKMLPRAWQILRNS